MIAWEKFCELSAVLGLEERHLQSLKTEFDRIDAVFFDSMLAKMPSADYSEIEKKYGSDSEGCQKFCFILSVAASPSMIPLYEKCGYDAKNWEEIRHDWKIWADKSMSDYGFVGFTQRIFVWNCDVLSGRVAQFGRLQCNPRHDFYGKISVFRKDGGIEIAESPEHAEGAALSYGDKTVNLHIPESGPLKYELCMDSIRRMKEFSRRIQPEYDYKAFVCYSWLLDPVFEKILKKDSNIVKYQKIGHLFNMHTDDTEEVIWRIFGAKGVNAVPHDTSMRKAVARYLESGGRFTEYGFFIFPDEI